MTGRVVLDARLAGRVAQWFVASPSAGMAVSGAVAAGVALLALLYAAGGALSPPGGVPAGRAASVAWHLAAAQVAGILLVGPAAAAGILSGMRRRATLRLLVLRGRRPAGVAGAAFAGALARVMLVLVAVAPVLAAAFRFAGLGLDAFLATEAVAVAAAVGIVGVTVLLSGLCSGPVALVAGAGLGLAVLLDAVLGGAVPAPGAGPAGAPAAPAATSSGPLRRANPLVAVHLAVLRSGSGAVPASPEAPVRGPGRVWLLPLAAAGGLAATAVAGATPLVALAAGHGGPSRRSRPVRADPG